MDRGNTNKLLFDQLEARKDEIERAFGGPLEWDRGPDSRRTTHIRYTIGLGVQHSKEHWPALMDAMIDGIMRLEAALREPLRELLGKD